MTDFASQVALIWAQANAQHYGVASEFALAVAEVINETNRGIDETNRCPAAESKNKQLAATDDKVA